MYRQAIHVSSRQFQQQERVRVLCENQDDHEARLQVIVDEANALNARYEVLLGAFERVQRHQSIVLIAAVVFGGIIASASVFFVVMKLMGR